MAKKIIETSQSTIARVAWLIQRRVGDIEKYEKYLSGEYIPPEWKGVSREQIETALRYERECLADLLDNDTIQHIINDFERLKLKYIREESK